MKRSGSHERKNKTPGFGRSDSSADCRIAKTGNSSTKIAAKAKYSEKRPDRRENDSRRNTLTDRKTAAHTNTSGLCRAEKLCGGCQYLSVGYAEQLKKKQELAERLFSKFAAVKPIIGMEDPTHYRNKVHHAFAVGKGGEIISGSYAADTHWVVSSDDCLVEDKKSQEIIADICKLAKSFKYKIYDEDRGFGLLRHVLIRRGFATGEILVVLVLASPILPGKKNFIKALRDRHPDITSIVININDQDTSMVLGDRNITIYGPGFIRDRLCGLVYRISPSSFYQINHVQTEVLYKTAVQYADLKARDVIVDAYCGIGTIGLTAAPRVSKLIGIELNPDAVRDARINAAENRIANAEFVNADASDYLDMMAQNGGHADVIFMDPPRSGSTEKFMRAAVRLAPRSIVYISCGPESLARDLEFLTRHGYKVMKLQPVDMFPQTVHVETVVLLTAENKGAGRG